MGGWHRAGSQGTRAAGDQPGAHNPLEETKRPIACLSLLQGGDMVPIAA